jgi:thiamine-monophosphate kinase
VSTQHSPLRDGVEFDLVRRMLSRWGETATGIGDDAAVIRAGAPVGRQIASTDVSVENVHFRRDWITPREIGYRSTAAALSDIAAMGAQPVGILVALTLPDSWREHLDEIADGIGEAAETCSTRILGGDLSEGRDLSLAITVLGDVERPLLRSGARAGDLVYVTGTLGGPSAALNAFLQHQPPSPDDRARFAHPVPRIREGKWLASNGVSAATDISDGLVADLSNIATASGVSISIDLDRLPVVPGVSAVDAAASGEEYELVVTSAASLNAEAFNGEFGVPLTKIGAVEAGRPGVRLFDHGAPVPTPVGYFHFKP